MLLNVLKNERTLLTNRLHGGQMFVSQRLHENGGEEKWTLLY